jgi:polyisoprenyl-teichoic acid--peptidoglycan teichoic acid transferase
MMPKTPPKSNDFPIYFAALFIVLLGCFGIYDDVANSAGGQPAQEGKQTTLAALPEPFAGQTRLRLVLMGADDRKNEGGRSDTLMVLWLNPSAKRGAIMSIPRDLRVDIPNHGTTKVNAAYAYGGPTLTVQTVEQFLSQPMDGYLKVNFESFVKAVDALGGVDVLVRDIEGQGRGMNYDDNWGNLHVHLTPGMHHLDGYGAMGFCRYRKSNFHGLGDGDGGRAERQQQFIRAILEQKLRVTNLPALMKAGREVMGCLDTSLSWRQCVDLIRLLKGMNSTDLKTVTIPVTDSMMGGIYYSLLIEGAFQAMLGDIETHLDGGTATARNVVIKDGTEQTGMAPAAQKLLTNAGFTVTATQPTTKQVDSTKVLYPRGQKDMATAAALALGAGEPEELDDTADAAAQAPSLQVILGRDYKPAQSAGRDTAGRTTESP